MAWLQGPLRTDKACSMKINLVGLGPCRDIIVKKVADGLGTEQTVNRRSADFTGSYRQDRYRPHCSVLTTALIGRRKRNSFWQIKVPLPITMSIPKLNGIAAIMYGWHYLHVLVVLYFFQKMVDPQGKNWGDFLSILLSAASWGGANSCSGAAMYK